jgi:hypothetical protein
MKYLKMLGLAALSAMALMAVTAGAASATTLEVGGVTQNKSVEITASLKPGSTLILTPTGSAEPSNTCTQAIIGGSTTSSTNTAVSPPVTTSNSYTGNDLTGPITELQFGGSSTGTPGCINDVTVHKAGTLHVSHAGGTNGTLTSSGAEVTSFSSTFGVYVNCKTGAGTHLGTLTGKKEGHAEVHVNAVLNCGFFVPSAKWEGTYVVTTPTGLGVVA